MRRDGVASRVAGLACDELRARGAFIDELQRACRDLLVGKAAAVGRVVLDVGICDGSFLPFAVRRVIAVYGDADRARLDGEGNGIGLRAGVSACLRNACDDIIFADIRWHSVQLVAPALIVGIFFIIEVGDITGLGNRRAARVGDRGIQFDRTVAAISPTVFAERDLRLDLRHRDLIHDRNGHTVCGERILKRIVLIQPGPRIVFGLGKRDRDRILVNRIARRAARDNRVEFGILHDLKMAVRRVREGNTAVAVSQIAFDIRFRDDLRNTDLCLGNGEITFTLFRVQIIVAFADGERDMITARIDRAVARERAARLRRHLIGDGVVGAVAFWHPAADSIFGNKRRLIICRGELAPLDGQFCLFDDKVLEDNGTAIIAVRPLIVIGSKADRDGVCIGIYLHVPVDRHRAFAERLRVVAFGHIGLLAAVISEVDVRHCRGLVDRIGRDREVL